VIVNSIGHQHPLVANDFDAKTSVNRRVGSKPTTTPTLLTDWNGALHVVNLWIVVYFHSGTEFTTTCSAPYAMDWN